jgi:hypothetical protein
LGSALGQDCAEAPSFDQSTYEQEVICPRKDSALLTRRRILETASILLTAAHCAGNFIDGVLMGGTSLDGSSSTLIPVATELPHPGYGRCNEFV